MSRPEIKRKVRCAIYTRKSSEEGLELAFNSLGSALLLIRELNAQGHRTKSWTTQAGTFREGRPFDKGTLYKILRNRVYIGEAVHKGRSYPGEHEPIVDRATWERVHEVLATNARRPGQRGARPNAGAAQGADALYALQLGHDAEPNPAS